MTYWARVGENESQVVRALKPHILGLVPEGPNELARKKHDGIPNAFQDLFVAFALVRTGSIGQHLTRPQLPARISFEALAFDVIYGPAFDNLEEQGHRRVAEYACMDLMSSFKYSLGNDRDLKGQLNFGNSEAGAATSTGDPYMDRRGNHFWIERFAFQVLLQLG